MMGLVQFSHHHHLYMLMYYTSVSSHNTVENMAYLVFNGIHLNLVLKSKGPTILV